jgi:hypothetical protein
MTHSERATGKTLIDEPVRLDVEPDREFIPGRLASRANVVAAGLTDNDINRMIKQAQQEVEPQSAL